MPAGTGTEGAGGREVMSLLRSPRPSVPALAVEDE